MAFSRSQQGKFRPLVDTAWRLHSRRTGGDETNRKAKDTWTRDELEKVTGCRSSKDCNAGRHFERACSHFEALGESGIEWQIKLQTGDRKRLRYAIQKISPAYSATFTTDHNLETYAKGIARNMFPDCPGDLHLLDDLQIDRVTNALRIQANRHRA